jgi:hypothetical protein
LESASATEEARAIVFGQTLRWGGAERYPPALAKRVDAEGPNLVDLGLDRSGIYDPLIHR